MSNESKRYVFSDDAEWSKVARCMPCVLHKIEIEIKDTKGKTYKTNLNGNERDILMFIILSYDMNALQYKQAGECNVLLSCKDIEEYFDFSRTTAYRICNRLVENGLLKCTNKGKRKGTSKSAYIPNVETLQKHIKDFLEKHPDFKI